MQQLLTTAPLSAKRPDRPASWPATTRIPSFNNGNFNTESGDSAPDRWRFERISGTQRPATEDFIATQFLKAYDARISEFMPELMGLYDNGAMAAACGLRNAAGGAMFLEHYLEHPVETVLGRRTGTSIKRQTLVEIGNLSISRPGYARHLVYWLTLHLHDIGMQWAVFSAVPALRNNFQRLGIPLITMAPANPDMLPEGSSASWGSYYEQKPQVTAVNVEAALNILGDRSCNR
jgi:hypothetical protein